MKIMTLDDVKLEWERLHGEKSKLNKEFDDKVKRNALSITEHEQMNKRYFKIKEQMERLVKLGKNLKNGGSK